MATTVKEIHLGDDSVSRGDFIMFGALSTLLSHGDRWHPRIGQEIEL